MATEPRAQSPGASLRASRADRERVVELLKAAFVQGRLAKDEFEARVGQALGSQTYAELAAVGADIPAGLTAAVPSHPPARASRRVSMNTAITGGALVMLGANAGMLAASMSGSAVAVILVAVFTVVGAILAIVAMIIAP